jgi:hypothetical protein
VIDPIVIVDERIALRASVSSPIVSTLEAYRQPSSRVGKAASHRIFVEHWSTPDGRWRSYTYSDIVARDKASLDIFWLRDESLEDSASLPDPHILAEEIADDLRTSLEQIEDILADLQARSRGKSAVGRALNTPVRAGCTGNLGDEAATPGFCCSVKPDLPRVERARVAFAEVEHGQGPFSCPGGLGLMQVDEVAERFEGLVEPGKRGQP